MNKTRQLVIVGDRPIAEVAFEYFTHDSEYEVAAFTVEHAFLNRDVLFGRPVVAFEDVQERFPPAQVDLFVAVGYGQMNRLRARLFREGKAKGYKLASFISPRANVWHDAVIGENAFIFESNVIQPFVTIGDDVVLWSGNHIGHHAEVGSHVFISSHVVVSGFVSIGDYSFVGVNATFADNVKVGRDVLVGAGALVLKDAPAGSLFAADGTKPHAISTHRRFGIKDTG
ncbi:MAG TPA: acetyltransferase [Thermoanaerobaculia bacterium]|nr:acetyltransferase [Thermoanaerobaculia bacterium]